MWLCKNYYEVLKVKITKIWSITSNKTKKKFWEHWSVFALKAHSWQVLATENPLKMMKAVNYFARLF